MPPVPPPAPFDTDTFNQHIVDSAVDYAIIALDLGGRVTRWTEGAHRVLGWTEEEMLDRDASCIFTPEDRADQRLSKEMQAALRTGSANDERWHMRKTGDRFWAKGKMFILRDAGGEAIGVVKVLRDRTEEHRAMAVLQESQARLQRAQSAGGVGTFTVDLAANRLHGTTEFYRIFGLPEVDSMDSGGLEALVIAEDASVRSDASSRQNDTAALDVEYRIRRANDGALRWIARKAEFERDLAGRPIRMVGVVQDITERKAQQRAIEDSASLFSTFAQALPNHVWTAPASGELDWFNDRVYAYSGAARGELDGHQWAGIVHPDDQAAAANLWLARVATGENYDTEFRIRRADGAYRWHLVRAVAQRASDGSITRWIGTNTDIHERKLAETESARERQRLWDLSQELMLVCDFEGVISAVNPAATRLLGWSNLEMVGQTLDAFIHPDDIGATALEVGKLSQGISTLAFENRYRARDGGYKRLSWTAVPEEGFIHAVARDVSRERAAEEALRQSQKLEAIGQLTGGVAHDFNNVLAVIRSSIDLLRRLDANDPRRNKFMESISNAVGRGAKLTGQLLAFARRQALQPLVFDLSHNTRAVAEMVSSLTGARVTIDINVPEAPCFVNVDPSQFDTALVNLAVNARDAMNASGRLTFTVDAVSSIPPVRGHVAVHGEYVAVSVRDTGAGIAPENLQRILEPFFTTKGAGQGTGLGLSQVFGFAKQSGGDLCVESTMGEGSIFTLYLPRATRPAVEGAADDAADRHIASGNGALVLVVEDNPELSETVDLSLQELGYKTIVVACGEDALAELEKDASRFALVFSDVVMSGMSGIELGQEIRRRFRALPVVLASGYSYVLAQRPDHGFPLLPKPYSLEVLARTLRDAIAPVDIGPIGSRRPLHRHAAPFAAATSESKRLEELESLRILDTEEDAVYDELTRLAANFCNAPIALISLVDGRRQWFKARVGLQARETPREHAFCAHAIQTPRDVMVVHDATKDDRFSSNPLVLGDPGIRFYAGAPLLTSNGQPLGTLCVIDREPRHLDARQLEMLQFLADQVIQRFEERRHRLEAAKPRSDAT